MSVTALQVWGGVRCGWGVAKRVKSWWAKRKAAKELEAVRGE